MHARIRVAAPIGAVTIVAFALCPYSARAAESPTADEDARHDGLAPALPSPLWLGALLDAVRRRSPLIAEAARSAGAARIRPRAEGLPDDPMVMLEWWQQPLDFSMVPWMVTVRQPIPWPSKLRLSRESAEGEARAFSHGSDDVVRRTLGEAKRAYFDLAFAETSLSLNDRLRAISARLVEATSARYRVGRAEQAEMLRAQSEVLVLENERLDLERARDEATVRMNALLDRPGDAPLGPTDDGSLRIVQVPPLTELIERAIAARPEVLRAAELLRAAEARRGLAEREALPDLQAWAGYMANFRGVNTFTLGVQSSLPIFATKRRDALTEAAGAEIAAARFAITAARRGIEAEVRMAFLQLETATRHARLHAHRLIPLSEMALDSARVAYEAGRGEFLAVLDAGRQMRMHHQDHVRFLVDYRKRLADLEQAIGGDLAGSGATEVH